ncbi:MAG: type II CRISPR-associated endonuclease Cas1 [Kiritimatiellia bacterium]
MSYHIIDISSEGAVLSVTNRQLICRLKDGKEQTLPMEDIGVVLVNSFSVLFHNSFLSAAAEAKVAVIVCERFKPKSIVLPVQRGGDTLLTRAQIDSPSRLREALWFKTIEAKVANQYDLMVYLAPEDDRLMDFRAAMGRRDIFKEGNCARLYWHVISDCLEMKSFRRQTTGGGLNSLLNYAYGVLLSRVLQRLLAYGLDPMYGIGHLVRERATPLAYDIMEPFRVAFDEAVFRWVKGHRMDGLALTVGPEFKRRMHMVMKSRHPYGKARSLELEMILDNVVKSLRTSFLSGRITEYRPWIRRSSEWGG